MFCLVLSSEFTNVCVAEIVNKKNHNKKKKTIITVLWFMLLKFHVGPYE